MVVAIGVSLCSVFAATSCIRDRSTQGGAKVCIVLLLRLSGQHTSRLEWHNLEPKSQVL